MKSIQKPPPEVFYKNCVLKNFTKFTKKTPVLQFPFCKVADFRSVALLIRDSTSDVFWRILQSFQEHLFGAVSVNTSVGVNFTTNKITKRLNIFLSTKRCYFCLRCQALFLSDNVFWYETKMQTIIVFIIISCFQLVKSNISEGYLKPYQASMMETFYENS